MWLGSRSHLSDGDSVNDLADALNDLTSNFVSFFISFAVIGRYWAHTTGSPLPGVARVVVAVAVELDRQPLLGRGSRPAARLPDAWFAVREAGLAANAMKRRSSVLRVTWTSPRRILRSFVAPAGCLALRENDLDLRGVIVAVPGTPAS